MNEYGVDKLLDAAKRGAIAVLVSSSTGDGDPPDNAAKFYGAIKRRSQPVDALKGLEFTSLGLGDSNYTRFMYIPRSLKTRFTDLGAHQFYECSEADEVDGIESVVDPWMERLWPALRVALSLNKPTSTDITATTTTTTSTTDVNNNNNGHIPGVPALPRCRVKAVFESEDKVLIEKIQKRDAEGTFPEPTFNLKSSTSKKNEEEDGDGVGVGRPSAEVPYLSSVKSAKWLSNTSSVDTTSSGNVDERKVIHMEVEVSGTGVEYSPGDSIGVFPENDDASIDAILARLGIDGTAVFTVRSSTDDSRDSKKEEEEQEGGGSQVMLLPHLRCPSTVKGALKRGCDITTVPKKSLLRILAEHCTNSKDKDALLLLSSNSPQGKAAYITHILQARPSLLDLLNTHPSCTPTLDALLDALPPLQPRMYSVACAPPPPEERGHGGGENTVSVAFSVVQYETERGKRRGVATGWLEDILLHGKCLTGRGSSSANGTNATNGHTSISPSSGCRKRKIPIFFRSGGVFRPHRDLSKPMIMIGPGTGVAPFIGFLQLRNHLLNASSSDNNKNDNNSSNVAPCWLFFGCRHPNQDYLYESELKQFKSEGTLDNLLVAFSRLGSEKVYVQHLMMKHKKELKRMIVEDGGYVYVCGDGANMARDVHSALVEIVGGGDGGGGVEKLGEMTREGRYIRDIWS
jgi:sulfite reductase alpha subunit-like flavoprotein